jgi:hypothetical protein
LRAAITCHSVVVKRSSVAVSGQVAAAPQFQPGAALPQRVGGVVQPQRDGLGLGGVAVEHMDLLVGRGGAQAVGQVEALADARGQLGVAAADRITQAVFAEHLGVAQHTGIDTEHQRIGAGAGLGDAGQADPAALPLIAAVKPGALTQAVVAAQGNAPAPVARHIAFHLGAEAEALGGAPAGAQAHGVAAQLGAYRQAADGRGQATLADDRQAGGGVDGLVAVAQQRRPLRR